MSKLNKRYMKEYAVYHNEFGEGIVKRIYGSRIDVQFADQILSMVFPGAFSTGLKTDDSEFQEIISKALEKTILQTHTADTPKQTRNKTDVISILKNFDYGFISSRCHSLDFQSNESLFETIGYLAKPGVVVGIWAEIPHSALTEFTGNFPKETVMPITQGTTPQGMSNKFGVQCRLNLGYVDNCPLVLKSHLAKGLGKKIVNRLNNTRFVLDLVKFFGFHFGNEKQQFANIKEIASEYGYLDEFMNGYNL
jgi:hypothetical protein